jgi:rubrerythrin
VLGFLGDRITSRLDATNENGEMSSDAVSASIRDAALEDVCNNRFAIFNECPLCGSALSPEHAHFRCPTCGWRDSCCD